MIIGYTTGVFDLFHIGHLNILRRAREKCDKLIVGVTTDELLKVYKNKSPIIPFEEIANIPVYFLKTSLLNLPLFL